MDKFNVGVIGLGFIGCVHARTISRLPQIKLAAVCDADIELAKHKALEYGDCTVYSDYRQMLFDPSIKAIHNCTPNHLHYEINKLAIENGKNILSEKPLGMHSAETAELAKLASLNPKIAAGVNFNYRMYPLIQEYRKMIAYGELGSIRLVHGRFLQDWLMYDTDYNWRVDKSLSGSSRAMSDIGSHWCDLAQTLVSSRISAVLADLTTVVPIRQKPVVNRQTFSSGIGEREPYSVDTEDYGAVMIKFDNGARGVFYVSQVSGGHKCNIEIEVNTDLCSIAWNHQNSEQLWFGSRNKANKTILRDPAAFKYAGKYTSLPPGHPEGFNDAFLNTLNAFYNHIIEGCENPRPDFATFEDGHYCMKLVDAILESSKNKTWVNVS